MIDNFFRQLASAERERLRFCEQIESLRTDGFRVTLVDYDAVTVEMPDPSADAVARLRDILSVDLPLPNAPPISADPAPILDWKSV